MERWLSKSRVLLGLCGVLLIAALNRQDPMVYGMFLFIAVVTLLGFVLPWVSLRSMTLQVGIDPVAQNVVLEGQPSSLEMTIERRAWWPAFMVDVETRWRWASRDIVLHQSVPAIRAGQPLDLGRLVQFPCRGNYRLVSVSLSSGFPLGLISASHSMVPRNVGLLVLPRARFATWPQPWTVSEDPLGDQTTRRLGHSFELGVLRKYQIGEPIGRVSWRASARIGELVIQHFQQSGSVLLRLVTEIPAADQVGDPESAAEQAIRIAAGVCQTALAQGVRLRVYLPPGREVLCDMEQILRAMAGALAGEFDLPKAIAQASLDMALGEQLAVVVGARYKAADLVRQLSSPGLRGRQVVVYIATGYRAPPAVVALAVELKGALSDAGLTAHTDFS